MDSRGGLPLKELRDRLEKLAWALDAMAVMPTDPWRDLARSVRAYRDGTPDASDYSRIVRYEHEVLRAVFTEADRTAVEAWLMALRPPARAREESSQ